MNKVSGPCKHRLPLLLDTSLPGFVTHVMRKSYIIGRSSNNSTFPPRAVILDLSGFHKPQTIRTTKGTLETVLTVFILPANGTRRRVHRRLDLIFALPEVYWTAITGWWVHGCYSQIRSIDTSFPISKGRAQPCSREIFDCGAKSGEPYIIPAAICQVGLMSCTKGSQV